MFVSAVDRFFRYSVEAGIGQKNGEWSAIQSTKQFAENLPLKGERPVVTMKTFVHVINLVMFVLILSCFVFLGEHVIFYISKRKRGNRVIRKFVRIWKK